MTTYADLRQRVLDGDDSVTAAQLEKAKRDEDFAALRREAVVLAAERSAEEQRQIEVEQLHDRARAAATTGMTEMQAHYRNALEALRALRAGMVAYSTEVHAITQVTQQLGVTDIEIPRGFNIEHEIDRLVARTASRGVHHAPFSRLVDQEYRDEAERALAAQELRRIEREEQRRAEMEQAAAERQQEQRRLDEQRRLHESVAQ